MKTIVVICIVLTLSLAKVDELALTFGQENVKTREQLLSAIDEILASAKTTLADALKDGLQTSDYLFETMVASIQMIRNYLGTTKDEKNPSEEKKEMVRMIVEFRRELFEFNLTGRAGKKGVAWSSIKAATENRFKLIHETAKTSGLSADEVDEIMKKLYEANKNFIEINEKVGQKAPKLFVGRLVRNLNKELKEIEESISA
ncbi:uncharacterized protein LOC141853760 isoform X2 [Brevipalpus obovatus]|uniref:uncharacterized protein LOC141853760 isoform X2 n=1 Tax=Brevipalpus obovatus TaxID=246614 RepID=UPI003D9F8CE3